MLRPRTRDAQSAARSPRVLFIITEDWFFVSHFLELADIIRRDGFEVGVHLRVNDPALRERIEERGIRVIPADFSRERGRLLDLLSQVGRLRRVLGRENPDIVHLISLRMIVLGGLAARWARIPIRIYALTGLGLLGAATGPKARAALMAVGWMLRGLLGGRRAAYVFENRDDPVRLGLDAGRTRTVVVGGAGIDPERETALPLPPGDVLKVAIVSRMIFSKGIAVAAEALTSALAQGAPVSMTLVGAPDPGNPRSLTEQDLRALGSMPGIAWAGRTADVRSVWRDHHVVCVPSLGGEGLPRSLLEGAAAGRPVITTNTPGCATFVRDGIEGLVVPPGNVAALARAFTRLAGDRDLVDRMAAAARLRALDGFTIRSVATTVIALYRELLAVRLPDPRRAENSGRSQ